MKKRYKMRRNIRYIFGLSFDYKLWFIIFIPILIIVLGQKDVAVSWLSAQIFNKLQLVVEGEREIALLNSAVFFAILLSLVNIMEWLITTVVGFIENHWREYVNVKLQKEFINKDFKINIEDFDNPDLKSRRSVAQSVDPVNQIMTIMTCLSKMLAIVSFAIILFQYSPIMLLISVVVKIPIYFVLNKINDDNRKFRIDTEIINREKNYYRSIPVDRAAAKEFKIFNMKDYICEKYDKTIEKYYKVFKGKYIKNATNTSFVEHYDKIIIIVAQIVIGISVYTGKMMFGDYTLLIAAFKNLSVSVETLVGFIAQFKDIHTQNNMFIGYMEEYSIFEKGETNKLGVSNEPHTFEFKDVSFSYPGTDKKIFHNLNLKICAEKTYGLVGLNGSGKSTLINLLLRLYEPDSGEILLDGVNINKYNIISYYEAIACVFQSTTHYAMSIKDYITSGKLCDMDKMLAVIKQINLDAWCNALPHGLDTMLTRSFSSENDSVEPSIGQWQKLAIARAIYKDAPVLILDEPSACLDVDSENEIFNYISRLVVKKTSIFITHRISNIIGCDHIFVLQNGCLVEQGTHENLLRLGSVYANLFESQAKYYK